MSCNVHLYILYNPAILVAKTGQFNAMKIHDVTVAQTLSTCSHMYILTMYSMFFKIYTVSSDIKTTVGGEVTVPVCISVPSTTTTSLPHKLVWLHTLHNSDILCTSSILLPWKHSHCINNAGTSNWKQSIARVSLAKNHFYTTYCLKRFLRVSEWYI